MTRINSKIRLFFIGCLSIFKSSKYVTESLIPSFHPRYYNPAVLQCTNAFYYCPYSQDLSNTADISNHQKSFHLDTINFLNCGNIPYRSSRKTKIKNYVKSINQEGTVKKVVTSKSMENEFYNKTVLLRCDLNVPYSVKNSTDQSGENLESHLLFKIKSDARIKMSLKTIIFLLSKNAKIILVSHLGRPKGVGYEMKYSLLFLKDRIEELLSDYYEKKKKFDIKFIEYSDDINDEKIVDVVRSMKAGDIALMENIRFHKGEVKNDSELGKKLGNLCDIYVNDAFGCSHREHSSIHAITKYVKHSVAGLLVEREIVRLKSLIMNPTRPFVAVIGGAKISTKITVIQNLLLKVDKLILGGAMVFTFLKEMGYEVGKSLVEDDMLGVARQIMELAAKRNVELILPIDFVVSDKLYSEINDYSTHIVPVNAITKNYYGVDNGPETTKLIERHLQGCKTILWNGPLGITEVPNFSAGTASVALKIAQLTQDNPNVTSVVGGGDSVAFVEKLNLGGKFSHVSSGGGATLEFLEKGGLPAIDVLEEEA